MKKSTVGLQPNLFELSLRIRVASINLRPAAAASCIAAAVLVIARLIEHFVKQGS